MSNLNQLTDAELSAVFAVEVAGWKPLTEARPCYRWMVDDATLNDEPVFATSMDAVLPHLELFSVMVERMCYEAWSVTIDPSDAPDDGNDYGVEAHSTTLPRAACIALILAARAEKEASQ